MTDQHNYMTKIEHLILAGRIPPEEGLHHVHVAHDEWCALEKGKRCDCDPWIFYDGERIDDEEVQA